jgi:hypothetical protein
MYYISANYEQLKQWNELWTCSNMMRCVLCAVSLCSVIHLSFCSDVIHRRVIFERYTVLKINLFYVLAGQIQRTSCLWPNVWSSVVGPPRRLWQWKECRTLQP